MWRPCMISVIYSGAGGGKTTSMVTHVKEKLQSLHLNRFLCVITFTNDATRDIKIKFAKEGVLPPNVFIGTIHSFLLRFIIKPHLLNGGNLNVVSGIQSKDVVMKEYREWAENKFPNDSEKQKNVVAAAWAKRKKAIYSKLLEHNLLTNDQIVKKSKEIVSSALKRKAIAKKIQYLFVDEYQDTYKWQHDVFIQIHKCMTTEFYVIGDPNQSIYSFAYGVSENEARRPKKYEDFPLCQLRNTCENYYEKKVNYRSSQEIVDLANTFNKDFQQSSKMGEFTPVLVIESTDPQIIYTVFNAQRKKLGLTGSVLYLSKKNKSLEPYIEKIQQKSSALHCIRSIESCITQYTGMNITNFCIENKITRFQFRTLAVLCGKEIDLNLKIIKKIFKKKFKRDIEFCEHKVGEVRPVEINSNMEERALTIHKSKGLEAESVLIIFDTNNHLRKIIKNKALMKSASDDDLRLGYVAITRAKKLLTLACKENINAENLKYLEDLNISISS
ncbi:MAG: ATP-dependent helicase [Candidatus Electrothrix sp. AR1]|nr:ATP-dependent helicase [Candidatus Electrothrix sp. AR1]